MVKIGMVGGMGILIFALALGFFIWAQLPSGVSDKEFQEMLKETEAQQTTTTITTTTTTEKQLSLSTRNNILEALKKFKSASENSESAMRLFVGRNPNYFEVSLLAGEATRQFEEASYLFSKIDDEALIDDDKEYLQLMSSSSDHFAEISYRLKKQSDIYFTDLPYAKIVCETLGECQKYNRLVETVNKDLEIMEKEAVIASEKLEKTRRLNVSWS